ncbi:bifunctional phosphopantothenoylcysteine decarboxylase/phosphopantothenate--cysteine ligase CoaBC [Gleimia sp. 6138-11-ORH1]|uniref:bifunctional phosphopantothenoylcysteine decarboxylase/phosphopantothenate--cysteine ligase CoaBC n=1 Tax=Gleimia sp. 6138-11-ORH1 TaxID=2973937 RepID=UPI002168C53B|nr:bifunctional phosphopantothenoylcysteine decarboxylase/phosphopantothenate--cysteine ligase CoaBC [Gleimia sp. 6138-11-ORH1]MCS4484363.1 bifunctional phosphopantothenoylcysteine decarboxylase/phosphopantothenate--cysteine ligase CoaBC [Gleimia sp. 6138-11-ORH1]
MQLASDFLTSPRRIVVGVSGGIAAYKIPYLVRALIKAGHQVRVIPTENSLNFVGKTTWEALSGQPVVTGVFDSAADVEHVEIAREAELIVIAPATADLLAKIRSGRADNLLTTTILAATCPVVLVPAMHTAMYENAATQENLQVLRERGYLIMEPETGELSSGDFGKGRLPEPAEIFNFLYQKPTASNSAAETVPVETATKQLKGIRVFITAGGTHEAIDPVRYIGNRSTGKFGVEIAKAFQTFGAEVTLIGANLTDVDIPPGTCVINTPSAQEMFEAVMEIAPQSQIGVFAAAVADFRPANTAEQKIKKTGGEDETLTLELVKNPDILASAVNRFPHLITVGFAAETGNAEQVAQYGREKAIRKGADLLAVNQVGRQTGFGDVQTQLTILDATGTTLTKFAGSKAAIAPQLAALVATVFARKKRS